MINKFDAINSLYDGPITIKTDGSIVYHGNSDEPSEEAIEAKLTELQAEYDSKQYQRDRKLEYPTIEELVVALYDEKDKQAIIEKRNAVKAKYPKPE